MMARHWQTQSLTVSSFEKNNKNQIMSYESKSNSTSSISLNLSNVVLDDVALFPVGAQLTSFCHDPLIGLISLTDPNGMITNFKYDKNGRLTSVIDHAGNIVKEYKYGYKIN